MYKNPETVDQSLPLMRTAIANKKLIMGGKKTEIKRLRVTFDDTEEKESNDLSVRLVKKNDNKAGVSSSNLEKRVYKTEEDVNEMQIMITKILGVLNQSQNQRSRSQSPTQHIFNSPNREGQGACYHCGNKDNFIRNCPHHSSGSPRPSITFQNRSRSPSPNGLNYQGSRMGAIS